MIEPNRVLKPLDEAEPALRSLTDYESPSELATAIETARNAVQRSLRLLLRADAGVSDELRLTAMSPADLPTDRLVEALRQRNLISIELAGMIHELERSVERIARGEVRAADADATRRTADRLELEVHAAAERGIRGAAHGAVTTGALEDEPTPVPPPEAAGLRRWPFIVGTVAVGLLAIAAVVWLATRSGDSEMADALEAFQADRLDRAESGFRRVIEQDSQNVTALLYLGRVYRRQQRYEQAAGALQIAARVAPRDPDVRRELGHLFLALQRPRQAAEQFRQATELAPADSKNWIWLVRSLRAAGDPAADDMLRRAPPEARAALSQPGGALPPDTLP
jgi:cytochrome c-type biogenesis protein CcmH/NrfG